MRHVEEGLAHMSATVREQMEDALASFHNRDLGEADSVVERDDVVDNIYGALEERIFEALGAAGTNISEKRRWRAALRVLSNLERIGDAATHIAKHAIMLAQEPAPGFEFSIQELADVAIASFVDGVNGFLRQDLELAKSACEKERETDEIYVKKLQQVMQLLDAGEGHASYLLHVLAAMKYLEKTGDFALNIGEAAFFSVTGTRLKYPQFKQLETLLTKPIRVTARACTATSGTAFQAPSSLKSTAPTATATSSKRVGSARSKMRSAAVSSGRTSRRFTPHISSAARRTKIGAPYCASSPMARWSRTYSSRLVTTKQSSSR